MDNEYVKLKSFLNGYEVEPSPQDLSQISGDFQLAGLKPLLGDKIFSQNYTRLLDIGCGNAIILKCIKDLGIFDKSYFQYIGIDKKDVLKDAYFTMTELDLYEQVSFRPLENGINRIKNSDSSLILYRNVFHELDIELTTTTIFELLTYMDKNDCLIIQDMSTLPVAEHSNVGWPAELLSDIFRFFGCSTQTYPDTSKSGIEVFIIVINKTKQVEYNRDNIKSKIIDNRTKQFKILMDEFERNSCNFSKLKKARILHDINALCKQLNITPVKSERVASELVKLALIVTKNEESIIRLKKDYEYNIVSWFQNRGKPLQMMDSFLLDETKQIMIVLGSSHIGKKTLIWHSLNKFKHNRIPLSIKIVSETSILSIFEQMVMQLKISHFLDVELLAESSFSTGSILEILEDGEIMENIVNNTIVIINDIEEACDGEKNLENTDILNFLKLWIKYPRAKIMIESNFEIKNFSKITDLKTDKIGLTLFKSMDERFGENQYPVQMLQELVPMDYRLKENSIGGFPEELLAFINNHPHIAYISAMVINQSNDKLCLHSSEYIKKLQSKILSDIIANFNISKKEIEFINILILLDKTFSAETLDYFTEYKEAKDSLISKGILNKMEDMHYNLLTLFVLAKDKTDILDLSTSYKQKMNLYFMNMFNSLFNKTSNPIYFRKYIFFSMICGQSTSINMYTLEQGIQIAERYFNDKEYETSLIYYNEVSKIKDLNSKQLMRKASCLIRIGEADKGLELYNSLFSKYSTWYTLRNSCVDALFYTNIKKYAKKAVSILEKIPENERKAYWYYQNAKANRELINIDETFIYFDKAIEFEDDIQIAVYRILEAVNFSKEILDLKRTEEYIKWLQISPYCSYPEAQIEIGSYFEKNQNYPSALIFLKKAYLDRPNNPYCILALVKVYCALEQYEEVEKIIANTKNNAALIDNNIIMYSEVYFYQCKNDFESGEKILFKLLKSNENNIHFMTQWIEFYLKKSRLMYHKDKSILYLSAKFKKQILDSINIPALLLLLNVFKLLNDENVISEIKYRIIEINPNMENNTL